MTVIFESADARSLAITAILTLFTIHAFLDPSNRGVQFAAPQLNQSRALCTYGANKVGQGALAGRFSSQMKYSLASLLFGSPKFAISGECTSG